MDPVVQSNFAIYSGHVLILPLYLDKAAVV